MPGVADLPVLPHDWEAGKTSMRGDAAIQGQASVDAIQPIPTMCTDYPDGVWTIVSRTQGCVVTPWTLTVTRTTNGVPTVTGTMEFLLKYYVYTSTSASTWAHQIEVEPLVITGTAAGTTVTGVSACTLTDAVPGACGADISSFPLQTLSLGRDAEGEAYQTFTGSGPSWGEGSWNLTMRVAAAPNPVLVSDRALEVRCDNLIGNRAAGCVFPQFTPAVVYSRTSLPQFARHVEAAQASGLPGREVARPLHRLQNESLQASNRATACPSASSAPWLPRPANHDCDEYPFSSTYEGAFTGGGTARTHSWCQISLPNAPSTGPTGYSICMVNASQNRSAGSQLLNMFNQNRVLDSDPFVVRFQS